MALQHNPFGFLSERHAQRRASQPKSVSKDQRYGQPLLIPDSPADLIEAIFRIEYKNEAAVEQSAPLTGENASVLAAEDQWSPVLSSIDSLMAARGDEDVLATEYAYRAARSVVESAYGLLRSEKKSLVPNILPAPVVITDDRGGVKLAWQQGAKHVRVSFGAAPEMRSYLYFESQAEHDVEDLQPSNLQRRLDWLLTP